MRAVLGQVRADYKEKSRSFSFLALMALCLFSAFLFVPRTGNGFEIMSIQPDIFMQGGNPTWIPVASALGLAFFLPYIGFFYLRNAMSFDEQIGVEQLITSSSIGNLRYLTGKLLSGTLLLYIFAITVIIGSFFMSLWHFPGQLLSPLAFFTPYLFLIASAPQCVAISILFGSVRFLRGAVGSVIYVIGVVIMIVLPTELDAGFFLRSFDVTAMSGLMEVLSRTAYEQTGHAIESVMLIGGYGADTAFQPTIPLVFDGLNFIAEDYAVFSLMLLIAVCAVILSVPLYGLTKAMPDKRGGVKAKNHAAPAVPFEQSSKPPFRTAAPSQKTMWMRAIITEIKLMMKGYHLIWYIIAVTGIALSSFLALNVVQTYVLPLLMLWSVNLFSQLGNREHKHDMLKIIATIPGGKVKQILFSWIAGFTVALLLALPVALRLSVEGQFVSLFAVIAGAVFLPSFAMALGEFTKTNRVFELVFIVLTYAIINGVSFAMYMGYPEAPSFLQAAVYLAAGITIAVAAIAKRGRGDIS